MNAAKIGLIIGGALVGAGMVIGGITFAIFGFDKVALSTSKLVTNTFDVTEDFDDINIDCDIDDIIFEKSDDGKCKVVCFEEEKYPHSVDVEGGELKIGMKEKNRLRFNFGIQFQTPRTTVYLPKESYEDLVINSDTGDVKIPEDFSFKSVNFDLDTGDVELKASAEGKISIKTDTGDLSLSGIEAEEMTLSSDTGKIELTDVDIKGDLRVNEHTGDVILKKVNCANFNTEGSTSDLSLTDVFATTKFDFKRSTGDVKFRNSDASEITVRTSTGDVSGSLSSDKTFITSSDTGDIKVPQGTSGGRCEISTDTGDITISIDISGVE
ncbi:MAG: DUF4097 family beta strand repeat protein [Clostridiales bacterium]|nr:DUF4097 family beta strand repeat protein [Clostridiales bacterium]